MKRTNGRLLITVLASLMATSCASTPDAAAVSDGKRAEQPAGAAKLAESPAGAPIAPADARLTLYCFAVRGIGHVDRATNLKNQLVAMTGWNEFYLIHSEDQSVLYYGYYRDFIGTPDAKERKRAEADRAKIVAFKDDRHDHPFRSALFVDLDAPDPQSPPEWNLAATPEDKVWTLEIGVYADSPLRKQYAVDAVRQARAMGIEAYYYHGDNASSVCVGAFPRDALKEQEKDTARTYNSDEPIVVLPGPLPAGVSDDVYVMQDGKKVKASALVPRIEPQDPKLIALRERFPHRSVNGEEQYTMRTNRVTGEQVRVFDSSLIVPIKRPAGIVGLTQPGAGRMAPASLQRPSEPKPGVGQLRGLGE
jgi:hypothetical protein